MREGSSERIPSKESEKPKQETAKIIPFSKEERDLARNTELVDVNQKIDALKEEIGILQDALAAPEIERKGELETILSGHEKEFKELLNNRAELERRLLSTEERAELESARSDIESEEKEKESENWLEFSRQAIKEAKKYAESFDDAFEAVRALAEIAKVESEIEIDPSATLKAALFKAKRSRDKKSLALSIVEGAREGRERGLPGIVKSRYYSMTQGKNLEKMMKALSEGKLKEAEQLIEPLKELMRIYAHCELAIAAYKLSKEQEAQAMAEVDKFLKESA